MPGLGVPSGRSETNERRKPLSRSLAPDAEYWEVFRFVGTFAWAGYGFAIVPDAIWFGRPWGSVGKHLVDAFVYATLTAGAFAGFWPG